jgi:hypothetical protein
MRRGSIARWMAVIGLSAPALGFFRGWIGAENWFGFLGLLGLMVAVGGIAGLMTAGVLRRFLLGFGATALVLWIAVFASPETILDYCRDRLILPVDSWLHPGRRRWAPESLETKFGWASMASEASESMVVIGPRLDAFRTFVRSRLYGEYHELQALLLIPMAILATIGGLIVAGFRPGRTKPSKLPDRP